MPPKLVTFSRKAYNWFTSHRWASETSVYAYVYNYDGEKEVLSDGSYILEMWLTRHGKSTKVFIKVYETADEFLIDILVDELHSGKELDNF